MPLRHLPPALLLLLTASAALANIFETNDTQRANLATAEAWTRQMQATTNATRMVRHALVADKASDSVTILAEATPVSTGTTIEFLIIGELSDRDYEGLFRSFAKPGDVAAALEFLGLPRGKNVNSLETRFFPRGERVAVSIVPHGADPASAKPVSSYIKDMQAKDGAPAWRDFVYCGSPDDPVKKDGSRLADNEAPNSILSTYNDAQTILDVPAVSPQSDVYERFVLRPESGVKAFALYNIVFKPVRRADGRPFVQDYALRLAPGEKEGDISYTVSRGGEAKTFADPRALVETFHAVATNGLAPHVSIAFDDALTLGSARVLSQLIGKIDGDDGIHVEPPAPDQVFYRCFLPNPEWRAAKTRVSQPWEAHFATHDGKPSITLIQTLEDWSDPNALDPKLSTNAFPVADAPAALKLLDEKGHGIHVLLVYAPDEAPLSLFMPTVRLLREKHPIIYVFGE